LSELTLEPDSIGGENQKIRVDEENNKKFGGIRVPSYGMERIRVEQ
jgi:hypothetical protein